MERSAGGVVFYESGGSRPVYLVMINRKGHWEFPKGHVKEGETDEQAALREVNEETGLTKLTVIPGFETTIQYSYRRGRKKLPKEVIFFLMQTERSRVEVSEEHMGYLWLPFLDAERKIGYKNARGVLERANDFLANGRRS